MDPGEQVTGTRDEHYNLISVLYHALHGAETMEEYILDTQTTGDDRLAFFFREAQATQVQIAERAKGLLGITDVAAPGGRIGTVPPEGITSPQGGTPLESDIPPEGSVAPGAVPETEPITDPVTGEIPPEGGFAPGTGPATDPATEPVVGDVPPRSAGVHREAEIRPPDEVTLPTEEVPPATDVPRTPPDAATPETGVASDLPPGDVQRETARELPPEGLSANEEVADVPPEREGGTSTLPDEPPEEPDLTRESREARREQRGL